MPKRKRTYASKKRAFKRRRYIRAKRRFRRKRSVVGNWAKRTPLPTKFKFHTRYVDTDIKLDPGLDTTASYTFRLSSLYDPDYTSTLTGHQPIGYDQLMLLYNHYTVIGTKVVLKFANTSNHPQRLVAWLSADALPDSDTNKLLENGLSKSIIIGEARSNSSGYAVFKTSHKKFFGKKIMGEQAYQGSVNSNPLENLYLHLNMTCMDPDVDPAPVFFDIAINFVALLTEPKMLGSS